MIVRELLYSDKEVFINAMVESENFHRPLIDNPKTDESFELYYIYKDGYKGNFHDKCAIRYQYLYKEPS